MITIGLIGMGVIGVAHYNAYRAMKEARVVAVADGRPDVRERLGDDTAVRIYPTLEELLANERVDIIDICTPTYVHADMAVTAFAHGCHVVCEKPMALTSADTQRMIDAARQADKLLMVGQVVRFTKPYIYLKSIIDSGELGRPVQLEMKRLGRTPDYSWQSWMRGRDKSGGTLYDYSIHDLDFVQYALGMPKAVSCVNHALREDNNDYAVSELIYDDMVATVTGGFYDCAMPTVTDYLAVFQHGYVRYCDYSLTKNGQPVDLSTFGAPHNNALRSELEHFVTCVAQGTPSCIVTPDSAQDTIKLLERLLENATEI